MFIAINRSTGKLYSYSPMHTFTIDDFIFPSIEDFNDCILEDEASHADDFLLFEVDKIFKPDVEFKEIDYESGDIY